MKLMTMKQYGKMTKASLVRKIIKALKKMPKMKLAKLCYQLEKKRLPTISTTKRNMPRLTARRAYRKFNGGGKSKFDRTGKKRDMIAGIDYYKDMGTLLGTKKKPRSAKQRANDKRLGRMARARAKTKRRRRRR